MHAVFDVHPLPGSHELGPFTVTGVPLAHSVPNIGIRVQAGEVALAYTGDTAPGPELVGLGRDADLFIVEATDRAGEDQRRERSLMMAGESGHWARQAGARRLVLTHFWPGNDRDNSVAAARETFGGDVVAAEEGCAVTFGGS